MCVQARHHCSLCFVGIHGYFSLAQSHISMQTEGREAEERPGVWHAAAPCKIWRQTEELAVNKRKYYQCGQFRAAVDTSLQERKLLKPQQSRLRKQGRRSLSKPIQPPDCVQRSRLAGQTCVPRHAPSHKNAFSSTSHDTHTVHVFKKNPNLHIKYCANPVCNKHPVWHVLMVILQKKKGGISFSLDKSRILVVLNFFVSILEISQP